MRILKDEADAAPIRRHEDIFRDIGQDMAVDDDMAGIGAFQSGDERQRRGFARARAAEERRDAVAVLEGDIERKRAELALERDIDHDAFASLSTVRFWMTSEAIRAASAIAIEIAVSRSALASPPGTCV